LAPGDSLPFHTYFEEWNDELEMYSGPMMRLDTTGRINLVAFGYVSYEAFGKKCKSRFCNDCSAIYEGKVRFTPRLLAPATYTEHT
jgi:hypothetical protein